MTTYTWIGNKGTSDPNDATQAANWSPSGVPGTNDVAVIGTGATVDFINTGTSISTPTSLTFQAAGSDTLNLTNQNFVTSTFTLGDKTTLNLTGTLTGANIAGFDVNTDGNSQSSIYLGASGASATVNVNGSIDSQAFFWVDPAPSGPLTAATGGTLTLNITQANSNIRGDLYSTGPILDIGGTLAINSDNSVATGNTSNRFSNAGYILIESSNTAAASATYSARMDGVDGVTELAGGTSINAGVTMALAAALEIATNMPGSQFIELGGGAAVVKIDANTVLPAYGNVVVSAGSTVTTTVLQNSFERFNLFSAGDTIDLVGVSPTGVTYSFGKDASYGNNVLTLSRSGAVIARLRFTDSSAFADGTGTYDTATFNSNFILSSDGAGGLDITVSPTAVGGVSAGRSPPSTGRRSPARWTGGRRRTGMPAPAPVACPDSIRRSD